jgi:DNA primase
MDVISLHQHGVDYAVATLGTSTTSTHVAKLLKLADELFFCFDGDSAGRKAAWRALENSLSQLVDGKRISFMFFPEGEDPDSYVRKCAEDAIWKTVPLSEFAVTELSNAGDLHSAEGRTKLLESAKPLLGKVTAPGLSLQLRHRFAALGKISVDELDALFGIKTFRPRVLQARERAQVAQKTPVTLTRRVLRVVLSDPTLAMRVDRAVLDASDRHFSLLIEVLDVVAARPGLGSKEVILVLLEALQDSALRAQLHEEVAELLSGPEVDLKAEFDQTIVRLAADVAKRREAMLSAKTDRSHAEQEEFVCLVRSRVQQSKVVPEVAKSRV